MGTAANASDPDLGSQLTSPPRLPPNPVGSPTTDTLEVVSEVEPPAPHSGAGPSSKQRVAEGLLTTLQPDLSETLVSQVGACYQFNVILPGGTHSAYFLDLTTGAAAPCPLFPTQVACSPPAPPRGLF